MNREALRLAVPNILSNVSVPLLSTVDTALMGHLGPAQLAAVGLASMLFNFLYWNFGFLRMGTTGITAQAYGARDADAQARTLAQAAALAVALAALLLAAQGPLLRVGSAALSTPAEAAPLVTRYFAIRIWAAPAALLLYVVNGWLFGQQNARAPLALALLTNGVNIAASVYLVRYRGWALEGVAWGTVLAQYVTLAAAVGLLRLRYRPLVARIRVAWVGEWGAYRRLVRVNADIFLRTLCLTFAFGFFYARSAAAGTLALASSTVLLQFLNWMSYAVDGFAYAAEALVGKYVGAGDPARVRRAIRLSMGYGFALAVAFALAYGLLGEPIVALFTDDAAVRAEAASLLGFLVALPLVGTACYIWDGVFVGLTATRAMRDTMLISLGVYLGTYATALTAVADPIAALWIALLAFLGARGLLQTLWFARRGLALG